MVYNCLLPVAGACKVPGSNGWQLPLLVYVHDPVQVNSSQKWDLLIFRFLPEVNPEEEEEEERERGPSCRLGQAASQVNRQPGLLAGCCERRPSEGLLKVFRRSSQGFLKAFPRSSQGLPKAFPKPSQGLPKAFSRPFQGLLKAFSRPSQGLPRAFGRP